MAGISAYRSMLSEVVYEISDEEAKNLAVSLRTTTAARKKISCGRELIDEMEKINFVSEENVENLLELLSEKHFDAAADKVERFKMSDAYKPRKNMADNWNQEKTNFREFKVVLADLLTMEVIIKLATLLFPPEKIDELNNAKENKGHLMVSLLEEIGQIRPNDISRLLNSLDRLKHYGLLHKLKEKSMATSPSYELLGKREDFLRFLKSMYRNLYEKVQPIPYIRELFYCVNDVFVECGLELQSQGLSPTKISHRDIFDDDVIPSKRILLEGDPGYGKSTITLKAAYEWCRENTLSPLGKCDMLILLPLRFLEGTFSLYKAIKLYLMPREAQLTESDIEKILCSSQSLVIILDGYDEYSHKDDNESDILKLIAGKMFATFKVVTSTRTAYLPKDLAPSTTRVRLTGFNDEARDEYIRKAVTRDDQQAAIRINDLLTSNPVLSDICEVPLFCVMFAHISYEEEETTSFTSVTSFFKYIISCFYNHMWRKESCRAIPALTRTIPNNVNLNKLAFDALTQKEQQIVWRAKTFKDAVGTECYNELITIGILIEEQITHVNKKPGADVSEFIQTLTVVRFYNKLFAEWYAAHYLSSFAGSTFSMFLGRTLLKINPLDLQFVFRFACGINKRASSRIIKFLKKIKEGQTFASLCFFEQIGDSGDVKATVTDLCSNGVTISSNDSRLLQRSNIQMMNIASNLQVTVPCLVLQECVSAWENKTITLVSGVTLPPLQAIEKILLKTGEREVESELIIGLAQYGEKCSSLTEIRFHQTSVMPLSIDTSNIPPDLKSSQAQVYWRPFNCDFRPNFQSGQWEVYDIDYVRDMCSRAVSLEKKQIMLEQWCIIQLLKTASINNISISCVTLDQSLGKIEKDEMILTSGITLPKLLTLEKIQIETEDEEEELSEDDVIKINTYALLSKRLKEVSFGKCLLPLSFSSMGISNDIINRNIKVTFCRYGYRFNFQSGLWEVDDVDTVRRLCSRRIDIEKTDSKLLQRCTIQLLQNASDNDIPITEVWLRHCSPKINKSDLSILLDSGLSLPVLNSLQDLTIRDVPRELTKEEFVSFLHYSSECTSLNELWFMSGYTLPETVSPSLIPSPLIDRNVKVIRYLYRKAFILKFDTGQWQSYEL